jgi:hypothetical protein
VFRRVSAGGRKSGSLILLSPDGEQISHGREFDTQYHFWDDGNSSSPRKGASMNRTAVAAPFTVLAGLWTGPALAQNCSGPPLILPNDRAEVEGELTVKSGKGCIFNLNGIPGAISEAVISQQPKVGKAGVRGLKPFYTAKPGYQGPDEVAYTFIGTGQYGGPMRVTIKRKITVVP